MFKIALLLASVALLGPAVAQERDDLESLVGRWVFENDGTNIKIEPSAFGWELWHDRRGQFALLKDGTAGANIKVSGRGPTEGSVIECFFYVSMIENGTKMVWSRRGGPPAECPQGKFSSVPNGKTRQEEIAGAREFRRRLSQQVSGAPADMSGVETVYFDRPADGGRVRTALEDGAIAFITRPSDSPALSNTITCQRNVPIEATKQLARTLLNAKVPIRVIRPSQYQQYNRRLTVESLGDWVTQRPRITLEQVDAMTTCNVGNIDGHKLLEPVSARPGAPVQPKVTMTFPSAAPPSSPAPQRPYTPPAPPPAQVTAITDVPIPSTGNDKVPITFSTGSCPDAYNVTARFWSPTIGAWQLTHLKGVSGSESFKNGDGTTVTTSTREVYFFARNLSTNQPANLAGAPINFPGSDVTYVKRGPSLTLNCR